MELETQCRGESSLSLSGKKWIPSPKPSPSSSLSTFSVNRMDTMLSRSRSVETVFEVPVMLYASRSYADKPSVPMALLVPHSRQSKTIALCTAHSAKHIVIWVCLCTLMFHVTERGICCCSLAVTGSSSFRSYKSE